MPVSHEAAKAEMKEHILVHPNLFALRLPIVVPNLLISYWYPIALSSSKFSFPKMWWCTTGNASIILFVCFKQCKYVLSRPSHRQCPHIALAYLHQYHRLCLACSYHGHIFSCLFLALCLLGHFCPSFRMQNSMPVRQQNSLHFIKELSLLKGRANMLKVNARVRQCKYISCKDAKQGTIPFLDQEKVNQQCLVPTRLPVITNHLASVLWLAHHSF